MIRHLGHLQADEGRRGPGAPDAPHASLVGALRPARPRRRAGGGADRGADQAGAGGSRTVELDIVRSVFYRNKGAYLVGRIRAGTRSFRWCYRYSTPSAGIVVDAVLMTSDEASVVFGFSWTYFRVDAPARGPWWTSSPPSCRSKLVHELYTAIGYNKHGKTELYRSLMRHLAGARSPLCVRGGRRGHGHGGLYAALVQRRVQGHQGQLRRSEEHHAARA